MSEPMTEEGARALCARLAATHADRATHQWLPRRVEDGWQVVKVALTPPADNLSTEQRAEPRPSGQDDVRTPYQRNAGEWAGPG